MDSVASVKRGGGGDSSSKTVTPTGSTETKLKVVNLSHKWTIDNFSLRPEKNGEVLMTPAFSTTEMDKVKWSLMLYPKGDHEEYKDCLSIFLKLTSSDLPKVSVSAKFSISIIDKNGRDVYKREIERANCIDTNHSTKGWQKFILLDTLFAEGKGLLPDDKLTLLCKVSTICDTVNVAVSGNSDAQDIKIELVKDFGDLLESKLFSDVVLLVKGQKFEAHKPVLAARSRVFAAMFGNDMKEKTLSLVEITDMEPEVFHELLKFIYTAKCDNLKELAFELLAGADKYALNGLKTMCEEELESQLKVGNAADILILADRYSASHLKAVALKFITGQRKEVMGTAGWKSLIASDRGLIDEVFHSWA